MHIISACTSLIPSPRSQLMILEPQALVLEHEPVELCLQEAHVFRGNVLRFTLSAFALAFEPCNVDVGHSFSPRSRSMRSSDAVRASLRTLPAEVAQFLALLTCSCVCAHPQCECARSSAS